MSDPKPQAHEGEDNKEVGAPLENTVSYAQEKPEISSELSNVAALGLPNTAELEKKIVRALDMWMLPQLWILYMFNYLNRTNIAQARLNTFNEDLNLKDGDYQTAVAILTVGYMLAQLPSNMLITRVRPSIYLPCAAFIWSAISAMTVLCTSAGGLWAVQFVLGIVEAPLFPGVSFQLLHSVFII
jgi:fucose permease